MQIPFDVAVIVCEIARLLWLQVALNNGWSERESRELFSTYQTYDRDGQGLMSQKCFELLRNVGIAIMGDEQYKVIELIKECDLNGDGFTGFDEFLYILKRFQDYLTSEELEAFVEASQNQDALPELFIEELEYHLEKVGVYRSYVH